MLGMRGCRLGIVYPILPEMQVRAIATATCAASTEGRLLDPKPEIMIPLVSTVLPELAKLRGVAEADHR